MIFRGTPFWRPGHIHHSVAFDFHALYIIDSSLSLSASYISFSLSPSETPHHNDNHYLSCLVTQLCPTLCDPIDCSPPDPSVCGILQARILEQVTISYSRGSSRPRDQTWVPWASCIGRWIFLPEKPQPLCIEPLKL